MNTVDIQDIKLSKLKGFEISMLWTRDLVTLRDANDKLTQQVASLLAKNKELEVKLQAIEDVTFVRIYA